MKRYINHMKIKCDVIDLLAIGNCSKTMGMTFVIYKYDTEDFHRIREHREFYDMFTEVENYNEELR